MPSIDFVFFVLMIWVAYLAVPLVARPWLILAAGLGYIASWSLTSLAVFLTMSAIYYVCGGRLRNATSVRQRRTAITLATLVTVGALLFVRYQAVHATDIGGIFLIGLSFYSLQGLGYVFDVYRGRTSMERSFPSFILFLGFFPLLTLGPIERHPRLMPQLRRMERPGLRALQEALFLASLGIFKKMVIADRIGEYAPFFSDSSQPLATSEAWIYMVLTVVRIYADFSAYTDLARAVARLFNIEVMDNFNQPYFARNLGEFWSRWHISLSTWFRDYAYWPILLKTRSPRLTAFVVFLMFGLWHGLRWNLIAAWLYLALLYLAWASLPRARVSAPRESFLKSIPKRVALVMSLSFTSIFFFANSLEDILRYSKTLFGISGAPTFAGIGKAMTPWSDLALILIASALVMVTETIHRLPESSRSREWFIRSMFFALVALSILFGRTSSMYFLYMGY